MALRELQSQIVLYDSKGNQVDVTLTNGMYEMQVADAAAETSLSKIIKLLEQQNILLHKILKKGKQP